MDETVFRDGRVDAPHVEVHESEEVDGLEVIVPDALGGLLCDEEGGVVDGPFREEALVAQLYFDDEAPAVCRAALNVEVGASVVLGLAEMLGVDKLDVGDAGVEDVLEEFADEALVLLVLEDFLEAVVGHGIDVLADGEGCHGLVV